MKRTRTYHSNCIYHALKRELYSTRQWLQFKKEREKELEEKCEQLEKSYDKLVDLLITQRQEFMKICEQHNLAFEKLTKTTNECMEVIADLKDNQVFVQSTFLLVEIDSNAHLLESSIHLLQKTRHRCN